MTENVFEFYLRQITNLLNKKKYDTGLELCKEMKARLLANPPVDPIMLGWQRFYQFLNLVQLTRDAEALDHFLSNEEYPFSLDLNQITYMTSISAELACNLKKVVQTLKLSRLSWSLAFKDPEIITRIQKAQNACIYFERLKENRLNFGFARFLTGFGKSNDIPVLYLQGLECLLANFRQSESSIINAILIDSLSALNGYYENTPENVERSRLKDLIDAINECKRGYTSSELYDLALKYVFEGKLAELRGLIDSTPDLVFQTDEDGSTLLMEAVRYGNEEAVELLLSLNADVHIIEDLQGSTPLLMAVNLGRLEIARMLLDYGADPEVKGLFGQTPLIRSVIEGHNDLIALLLEYGTITDRRDESGNTAIMHAVEDGKIDMVKSLIYAGADATMKNAAGMSIYEIAKKIGNTSLVSILKPFKAR